jgi:hypothetical protein
MGARAAVLDYRLLDRRLDDAFERRFMRCSVSVVPLYATDCRRMGLLMNYSDEAITHVEEIVKAVEFELASNRTFRLEVVKGEKGTANVQFGIHYYERQTLYKASDGTIRAEPIMSARYFYVWVPDVALPGVAQHSPEAALQQALDWLAERRNNQNIDW